ELQGAAARARAEEERKRRKLGLALVATVLTALLLGGGGYAWLRLQRAERRAATARAVTGRLERAVVLREQAAAAGQPALWGEALAEAAGAEDLLAQGEGDEDLRRRAAELRAELERDRDEARRRADDAAAERLLLA